MEILKKFCPVTVACFLLFASVIACFAGGVPFSAYADSQSDIGGGSLRIQISPMALNESSMYAPSFYPGGFWGTDESTGDTNVINGAVLSVKVPVGADAYVAYDLDLADDIWTIKGDHEVDGVPYMKLDNSDNKVHTNRDYDQPIGDSTVGYYYPASWHYVDKSADESEDQYIFRLASAGTLLVRVESNGEYNEEEYVVNNIDWTGAQPVYNAQIDGYMLGLQSGTSNGMPTYRVRIDFTDAFPTTAPYSATSGIKELYILRFDDPLTDSADEEVPDYTDEELAALVKEHKVYNTAFNPAQRNATVRFDLQSDGWYYYYTMDGVGNISIGPLLDNELVISGDPDYIIKVKVSGGTEVLYNVRDIIKTAESYLSLYAPDGENPVNEDLYDDLDSELAELTLAFRTLGDTDEAMYKKGELYYAFFNGIFTSFKNAVESGSEIVSGEVINGYLADGTFTWDRVDTAVNGYPGDEVQLRIILGGIDSKMPEYDEARNAAGIKGTVIRVEYELFINGARMPQEMLTGYFTVDFIHASAADCAFITTDGGTYKDSTVHGAAFDRVALNSVSGVIYLVIDEPDEGVPYWVWIIVGVAAAAVIAAAVVLVLYKKGVIGKNGKKDTGKRDKGSQNGKTISSGADSANDGENAGKGGSGPGKATVEKGDYDD